MFPTFRTKARGGGREAREYKFRQKFENAQLFRNLDLINDINVYLAIDK